MDNEDQFLGFFGIWRRSFKIISNWPQTFLLVAVALTQPLSMVYLIHTAINSLFFQNISHTLINTLTTTTNTTSSLALEGRVMAWYALFQIAYLILLLASSLSQAGIIYACIYRGKKVTVKEVIYKVWKRLLVTFVCVIIVKSVYELVFGFVVLVILRAYPIDSRNYIFKYNLPDILCSIGVWYMDVIWQLANTISVVEESCGFQALRKSQKLIKGKMGISVGIILVNKILFSGALWLFIHFVGLGAICLLLLNIVILLEVVVRTVLYLVCKSYHNEQIDEYTLTDHLEDEDLKLEHGQPIDQA